MKRLNFKFLIFRMFTGILALVLTFSLLSVSSPLSADNDLDLHNSSTSAKAMCLIEAGSGRIIYGKNTNQKLAMASTTKIMTVITALENCHDLDTVHDIPNQAVGIPGTSIYLKKGERLSVRELLYGVMLPSGNDASVALGIIVGESLERFVLLMNELASQIGAENSHFMNTHGLDEEGHYTTAKDLALITAYAMKNPTFKEVVSTKQIKITGTDETGGVRYLRNKNKLLAKDERCVGVKTGYTSDAGRCYVGAMEESDMLMICVVLNCGPMFEEAESLMVKALKDFKKVEVLPEFNYIRELDVEGGKDTKVKVYSRQGFKYVLTEEEVSNLSYMYELPGVIEAPIMNDEEVGEVEIYLGSCLLFSAKIYTMEEVKSTSPINTLKEIIKEW